MSINFSYGAREAIVSLKRNWIMSIAAVSTVAISLTILGSFIILALNISGLIDKYQDEVEVTVFLRNAAVSGEVADFQRKVRALPTVSAVDYVSKEEALRRLKKTLKDPNIVSQLQINPLPASLEIRMKDSRQVKQVAATVEGLDKKNLIDGEVKFGGVVTERLFTVMSVVQSVGVAFLILLGVASLIIISNTIRLAIFSRRREIGIMKLVGATNWFIRWPFLLEGIVQGLAGATLALLVLWAINAFFIQNLLVSLPFLPIDADYVNVNRLVLGLMATGVVIGSLGSVVAIRRYLKI